MYAAAGGASIANRRKQKRLQLSKQQKPPAVVAKSKITGSTTGVHAAKFSQPHVLSTHPAPSSTFHSSHEHHRQHSHHHQRRRPEKVTPHRLAPPLSPIQFPISPPPLSLESANSPTLPLKSNHFPFPPPSFLDLRVSPSTSELQCGAQGPGKAAWQGCSRPSPLPLSPVSPHGSREGYKTKQCEAHRRWMKRNRIRDASYCYGSSGEDDDDDSQAGRRRPEVNAAFNTVLYAGLGTTALGLVISFVGTGEKGFLSPELRLVGPSLLCAGLLCCLLRVLLCLCLCHCCDDCRWKPCKVVIVDKDKIKKEKEKISTSPSRQPTTSLLPQRQNQIAKAPTMKMSPPSSSSCSKPVKGHELLLSPAQLPE
ncbi:uncharacterized protein [Chelonus insularis]|uniref:uncharacterized protein n=1 Tax=Chelonus insularis TaxID=460826 RepID=UPI00158A4489|nr:uncharacterized protein LOC118069824 [Chelonus insularis]XP_034944049.1 uncharacterized protein LOC118069824 [Chelonus insularis]XP_034944050.1 uncharacterized protein LOC118069824 [Chelonus insularis]